jgi:hypothetical protein
MQQKAVGWYLQMLKRNERDIRVSIKPEIPTKKSVEEQYKLVRDLSNREFTLKKKMEKLLFY